MKHSKAETHCKTHGLPELRFEDSQLTSFSGLILLQELFARLDLKDQLRRCFNHLANGRVFGHATLVLVLVVHLVLGYRQLRDIRYSADDPLVKRVLGLRRLPDVSTLSRGLAGADPESVERLQGMLREGVLRRLIALDLPRVTLDFDGSDRHGALGRGHRGGIQPQEERPAQLLSALLHGGPDRTGARCAASLRQRPRLQRRTSLYPRLYRRRAQRPARGLDRDTHGQRLFQ